jgi:FlaA1/EpsC-like NDP-sugar epimerase
MKPQLLLPNRYKTIGWFILVPAALAGLYLIVTSFEPSFIRGKTFAFLSEGIFSDKKVFSIIETDLTTTLVGTVFLVGALLVAFSREKLEDEYVSRLRATSLLWAVLVNYVLLLLAFLFVYGVPFMSVMVYNMFTVLLIFIARFHFILYQNSKTETDEKHYQSTASY